MQLRHLCTLFSACEGRLFLIVAVHDILENAIPLQIITQLLKQQQTRICGRESQALCLCCVGIISAVEFHHICLDINEACHSLRIVGALISSERAVYPDVRAFFFQILIFIHEQICILPNVIGF